MLNALQTMQLAVDFSSLDDFFDDVCEVFCRFGSNWDKL